MVLVLETSLSDLFLGVGGTGMPVQQRRIVGGRGEVLDSEVNSLLQSAWLGIHDITHVVVSCGPGSFTGLRNGMAYAQGLCFGGNRQLLAVSSLAALASQVDGPCGATLWARPGHCYAGLRSETQSQYLHQEGYLPDAETLALLQSVPRVVSWGPMLSGYDGEWVDLQQPGLDLQPLVDLALRGALGPLDKPNYLQNTYERPG